MRKRKGQAIAIALGVLLLIFIIAAFVPEIKQTIIDFLNAIFH